MVAPLPLWPSFSAAVRGSDYRRAFLAALFWAAILSAAIVALTEELPKLAGARIVHGESYRSEMFRWIEAGIGTENEPRRYVPQHLFHLALFVLLSWVSAGYLGLALGAGLVAYMSYFVGSFALASGLPIAGALAAWVPWSIVRLVAFVAIGTICARPLLVRRLMPLGRREWRWLAAALVGIGLDLVGKALLAPTYGLFLRDLLGVSAR